MEIGFFPGWQIFLLISVKEVGKFVSFVPRNLEKNRYSEVGTHHPVRDKKKVCAKYNTKKE